MDLTPASIFSKSPLLGMESTLFLSSVMEAWREASPARICLSAAILLGVGSPWDDKVALFLFVGNVGDAELITPALIDLLVIAPAVFLIDLRSPGKLETPSADIQTKITCVWGEPPKFATVF